jgi:hypothetical protein
VQYRVYKNGRVVEDFSPCGAYLFGTDGVAVRRSTVTCSKGLITCNKPHSEAAGLALLWPVDGVGTLLLPTTCLPEREEPYILNVEMARAKLMQIINKCEDWSFFDGVEGMEDVAREARGLFIRALQNISNAPVAAKLGDEALRKAVVLSEKLAVKQAEALFAARVKNRQFSRGCLGCRVDTRYITKPAYVEKIMELFGFVTVPVSWGQIEKERGRYDFSMIDTCISALAKRKLAVCLGPLLCFSEEHLPSWLLGSGPSFEKVREAAYQFVAKVVARYSGGVQAWRVLSGLNAFNYFGFSFHQVLEMTRAANMAVRAANDRAARIIEITNPWGEYYARVPNTLPPLVYVDMVVQSGISFDAFGLVLGFGRDAAGMHVRDMMQVSAVLDYFGAVSKPLYITGVEVPSRVGDGEHAPGVAGVWHREWDESRQAQWIEQFYKLAFSKPFVETVTYSTVADIDDSTIAHSGLLTRELKPKDSFRTVKKLYSVIFGR